jgi:hypothetical protein
MGFAIYGPPILQTLRGYSPLLAGYVVSIESLAWTIAALVVARAEGWWDAFWVRVGALCVAASVAVLAFVMADGALAWVLTGGALLGAGFGFAWSFLARRILAALYEPDRAIGSAGLTVVRQTGAAAGAAIAGAAANLAGVPSGLTAASARGAGFWVFASAAPLAVIGAWWAFRLTSARVAAKV